MTAFGPGRKHSLLPALAKNMPPAYFLNASRPPGRSLWYVSHFMTDTEYFILQHYSVSPNIQKKDREKFSVCLFLIFIRVINLEICREVACLLSCSSVKVIALELLLVNIRVNESHCVGKLTRCFGGKNYILVERT